MSNFRRARTPGATYFFTVVIFRRRQILTTPFSRAILREALAEIREKHPFVIATSASNAHKHAGYSDRPSPSMATPEG